MPMGGGANASPAAEAVAVGIAEHPPSNTSQITVLYGHCAKTTSSVELQ